MDVRVAVNQGFMNSGDLLNTLSMRPFINHKGQKCIIRHTGFVIKNGKQEPTFKEFVIGNAAPNTTLLRPYEWQEVDSAVIEVFRQPLIGVQDLIGAGLTKRLGGIGTTVSTYAQLSDMSDADVSMTIGPFKGENDRVAYTNESVPVPIISKPFNIDARMLDASRRGGEGLDVTQIRVATRKVREQLQKMLFNGSKVQLARYKIYGYTNAPYRIADTAANFGGGDFATDGNGHKTFVGMISALNAKGFYGPFGVYVSTPQYSQLLALTGVNLTETQLSVILRTIPDLRFIRNAPDLSAGITVMVQLTSDVIDIAIGEDITPLQWSEEGGLLSEFRVLTAAVPRIKSDANGACGVAVASAC